MRIAIFYILLLCCFPCLILAQTDSTSSESGQARKDAGIKKTNDTSTPYDDTRILHRKEVTGGILIHTMGLGLNLRFAKNKTWKKRRILQFEFVTLEHPKESHRRQSEIDPNGADYVFGKLHSMGILRGTYGWQSILFDKQTNRGVRIGLVYLGGFSLAFLKPEYYEIYDPKTGNINAEPFDINRHSIYNIAGAAPFLTGFDKMNFLPGLHLRLALNFEYAPANTLIRFFEVGVNTEFYYKEVPLMANEHNDFYFITFFINWQIGKKIYQ